MFISTCVLVVHLACINSHKETHMPYAARCISQGAPALKAGHPAVS